jgi:hypothetical protein
MMKVRVSTMNGLNSEISSSTLANAHNSGFQGSRFNLLFTPKPHFEIHYIINPIHKVVPGFEADSVTLWDPETRTRQPEMPAVLS